MSLIDWLCENSLTLLSIHLQSIVSMQIDLACSLSLPLAALRPVGWEKREWRTWCWMRMMTSGSPWDTNTLLRCQRELLSPNDHVFTQGDVRHLKHAAESQKNGAWSDWATRPSCVESKYRSFVCVSFSCAELWLVLWKNSLPVRRWTLERR